MILLSLWILVCSTQVHAAADRELPRGAGRIHQPICYVTQAQIVRLHKLGDDYSQSVPGNHIFELGDKELMVWYPMDAELAPVLPHAPHAYVTKPDGCILDPRQNFVCASMASEQTGSYSIRICGKTAEGLVVRVESCPWTDMIRDVCGVNVGIDFAAFKRVYDEFFKEDEPQVKTE